MSWYRKHELLLWGVVIAVLAFFLVGMASIAGHR
jgi:hypothetical protein